MVCGEQGEGQLGTAKGNQIVNLSRGGGNWLLLTLSARKIFFHRL